MKKIIHFKFNLGDVPFDVLNKFTKDIQKKMPDYTILVTPFDITFENENDLALSLNSIDYTHKQLEEMLDKAQMYDELCK